MVRKTGVAKTLRKLLAAGLMITFGLVAALVILEIVLQFFPLQTRSELNRQQVGLWQSDDELILKLKPDLNVRITAHPDFNYTIQTNADGLRDRVLDGPVDIVAIGDSFTFGFGVDEPFIWPTRLEALSGKQVANLGWNGWNSYVYPATIKRYAIPLNARVWIWMFFVNDLAESAGAQDFLNSGQRDYLNQAAQSMNLGFPYNLRSVEYAFSLLYPQVLRLEELENPLFDSGLWQMRLSYSAWNASDPTSQSVQRGWELTESALAEAQNLAADHQATLLLVHAPAREHVYWPLIKHALPDVDVQQLDTVATRLASITDSLDMYYLDLLPGFRAEVEQGELLYFPTDGHWNAAGNDLAAHSIYEALIEYNLLPN